MRFSNYVQSYYRSGLGISTSLITGIIMAVSQDMSRSWTNESFAYRITNAGIITVCGGASSVVTVPVYTCYVIWNELKMNFN